jgi:PLP dependent protein
MRPVRGRAGPARWLRMGAISSNLQSIHERIARAAERSGRSAGDVTLIAVSKSVPVQRIVEAIEAGITHFGENRVQEAEAKFATRFERAGAGAAPTGHSEPPPRGTVPRESISLHMIGGLQRNKAYRAASLFDWVHSVDRPELVAALDKAAGSERPGGAPLPVLLQVNLTGEATKSGVPAGDLPRLADALAGCTHLRGVGLMTIARMGAPEAELRRTFGTLRRLLEDLRRTHPGEWRHLSMGMSDDFEAAIEEGATMVRLGRAVFGERTDVLPVQRAFDRRGQLSRPPGDQ